MILTLSGPNDHQRKQELARRISAFIGTYDDMAVERLDGEDVTAERMHEAVQSMPFLSARKLVVLREPSKQKKFVENIVDILASISEVTDVIIHEPKLDKRSSYYKTLKKQTEFHEFVALDAQHLAGWAVDYITEQGGVLSRTDAVFLIDRIGPNQEMAQNELDKLLTYNLHITKDTIMLLTEPLPQSTVFELLDAVFAGKTSRAFTLYKEQRSLKVEPQAIIAMLAWQLYILAVVKAAGTRSVDAIAAETKLNPFVIRKSQTLVRRLEMAHIRRLIADLLQIDIQLKSITIDADDALQNYLLVEMVPGS